MVSITVTSDVDEVLGEIADDMDATLAKAVLKGATFAGGAIARVANDTFDGGTGNLARDFLPAKFVRVSDGVAAGALSDLPYAGIQDEGGTIRAKGRMLSIPLTPEAKLRWPRDWPSGQLFAFRSKRSRNVLLAQRVGSGKLRFHYVLKESVEIPATRYIQRAAEMSEAEIADITESGLQDGIDSAGGAPDA